MRKFKIYLGSHGTKQVDLAIVAGEHSGDQHAAIMVKEIKKIRPNINIVAFGGRSLREAGADVIVDMTKFAVVGVYEIIPNLFFLTKLLNQTVKWIEVCRPKAVCLVDYPEFNLKLARKLFERGLSRKSGGNIKVFYYISPQIWAWRPKRRHQMAKVIDSLAVILPFEKKYFEDTPLDVNFVGHPLLSPNHDLNILYNPNGPVLLLPGSRVSSIKRIFPLLLKSFLKILAEDSDRMAIVVYPDEIALVVLRKILNKNFPKLVNFISFIADGESVEACATIMSSGTMSLRCCLAGIPGAIVYKTHPLTYSIGKILVKINFIGIANILLDRCVWREFLQSQFRPKSVAKHILQYLKSEKLRQSFAVAAGKLRDILSTGADVSAARWMLSAVE